MSFWCLQFLPKNEQKQVDTRFHGSKVEFICSFCGGNVGLKKSFRLCLTFSESMEIFFFDTFNKYNLSVHKGVCNGIKKKKKHCALCCISICCRTQDRWWRPKSLKATREISAKSWLIEPFSDLVLLEGM
jgi:hypothetical protein